MKQEIFFFEKSRKFLNEDACKFILTLNLGLSQEKYLKEFAKINGSKGNVYLSLMRRACLSNKDVVELDGCTISRHRGYN